ncbi:hypothetical protein [Oceanobacter mangrovi]|uniref:hypothetical protein n=1 Tax=Oceanobacter mangrovi TaxID=2862510 RepID=UPI001C8D7B8D|nr:hypothetical protein [Oceanobacter mangrovi]
MNLSVKTFGFTPYEVELIKEQIRVTSNKTTGQWSFEGEGTDADLVLARVPCQGQHKVQVPLYGFPLPADRRQQDVVYLKSEWPLRIFGLLEIFRQAESVCTARTSLPASKPAESAELPATIQLAQQAARIKDGQSLSVEAADNRCYVRLFDGQRLVLSNLPIETLASRLVAANSLRFESVKHIDSQYRTVTPLKSLLWSMQLQQPVSANDIDNWNNKTHRLLAWPALGQYKTSSFMFRLCTLLTKQSTSIQNAARLANTSEDNVVRFLTACQLVGTPISSTESPARGLPDLAPKMTVNRPVTPPAEQQLSLLQSLRNKLRKALS